MIKPRVMLSFKKVWHDDSSGFADATKVVANQVDDHDVLSAVLFAEVAAG
ncbi:unannotated protein [freshwater metagenome]|uniref:Unannotated protein n=1 Tax=freshwater metagenome TaxID=449393 RepID=A0A6J6KX50_9ZZZZ